LLIVECWIDLSGNAASAEDPHQRRTIPKAIINDIFLKKTIYLLSKIVYPKLK